MRPGSRRLVGVGLLALAGTAAIVIFLSRGRGSAPTGEPVAAPAAPAQPRAPGPAPPRLTALAPGEPTAPEDPGVAKGRIVDCWSSKTCPLGTTCWLDDEGKLGCFASNCAPALKGDDRCGAGRRCEAIDRRRGVWRCVAAGHIPENGVCMRAEMAQGRTSCSPGLACWRHHCVPTCDPKDAGTCAGGVCALVNGTDWTCLPGCRTDADCRVPRNACVALGPAGERTCVLVREDHPGEVCRPDGAGCGSGQRCEFALAEDELVSACRPTCSVTSACPDAMVCASGPGGDLCLARCDPARPTCPGRESCVALDAAGREWGCRLMPFAERPGVHVSRARGHFSDPTSTPL